MKSILMAAVFGLAATAAMARLLPVLFILLKLFPVIAVLCEGPVTALARAITATRRGLLAMRRTIRCGGGRCLGRSRARLGRRRRSGRGRRFLTRGRSLRSGFGDGRRSALDACRALDRSGRRGGRFWSGSEKFALNLLGGRCRRGLGGSFYR